MVEAKKAFKGLENFKRDAWNVMQTVDPETGKTQNYEQIGFLTSNNMVVKEYAKNSVILSPKDDPAQISILNEQTVYSYGNISPLIKAQQFFYETLFRSQLGDKHARDLIISAKQPQLSSLKSFAVREKRSSRQYKITSKQNVEIFTLQQKPQLI